MGMAACEDTVVPDARREVREARDAQDVLDGAHGFRPKRRAHDAVRTLQRLVERGEGRWIDEADMVSFFDRVDRTTRKELRGMRVAEGSLMRRIGTCLHVGGRDGDAVWEPECGTAQGSVLSPLWGNVDRPEVRDRWCETAGKPRLQGQATLIRYGEDVLSGFEREDDARRVVAVLDKRMERVGLTRHPDKTRLLPFRRPPKSQPSGQGPATFDVVGFTCYGARSRTGHWWMACQTRRASLRRAKTSIDAWCRRHRHGSIKEQHAALPRRLRGHCNSFGVRGNSKRMRRRVDATKWAWYTWRRRRSQRTRLHWERFTARLRWWPLPRPRITVRMWDGSPRATSTEEPYGGNLPRPALARGRVRVTARPTLQGHFRAF
jgi:RNA-directed DNA polymerase